MLIRGVRRNPSPHRDRHEAAGGAKDSPARAVSPPPLRSLSGASGDAINPKEMMMSRRSRLPFACLLLAAASSLAAPAAAQERGAMRQACAGDFRTFCADVQRGGGRIVQCLKANEAKLSAGCRSAMQQVGLAQ
jgi:hypothetical protein